jgi:Leucine-rich repeat (LRR) protein
MKKIIFGKSFLTILILVFLSGLTHAAIPAEERAALIALYNATNGNNWTSNNGWKTPPLHTDGFAMPGKEGTWFGITVSRDHVTTIYLRDNNLSGSIPSALGNLSNLEYLDLCFNHISGSIPTVLGNLSNLTELKLYINELTGNIPI